MATTFRILGPLEVRVGDRAVALGGPKPRAVLAMLLLRAGEVVTTDALIEGLWGERPPATARGTIQVYVSQLRRALADADADDAAIETAGAGYVARVAPGALDLARFDARVAEGRAALDGDDAAGASEAYAEALALWRGPALADFTYEEFAQRDIAHLEERRLAAVEAHIDADLRLGRHADLVPELERLVAANPLRERMRGQLMLALYGSGRQADALERYAAGRRAMIDELGIEPGAELRELEGRILRQDPDLLPPPAPRRPLGVARASRPSRGRVLAIVGAAVAALAAIARVVRRPGGRRGAPAIPGNSLVGIDAGSGSATAPVALGGSPSGVAVHGRRGLGRRRLPRGAVKRVDPGARRGGADDPGRRRPRRDRRRRGRRLGHERARRARCCASARRPTRWSRPSRCRPGPRGVAVADGAVWVASRYARTVTRVDASTGDVELTAAHRRLADRDRGRLRGGLDDPRDRRRRLAARSGHGARPAAHRRRQRPGPIQVGDGAVWVANTLDGTVSRIDPATNAVVATVQVGEGPAALAVMRRRRLGGRRARRHAGRASTRGTDTVAERIETGQRPSGLAADGGRLWVAARDASAEHRGGTLRVGGPRPSRASTRTTRHRLDEPDRRRPHRRTGAPPAPAGATLVPDLATSLPTPTDGGRTYTFTLREGSGTRPASPVRPGDIRRGDRALLPARPAAIAGLLRPDRRRRRVPARACGAATFRGGSSPMRGRARSRSTSREPEPDLLHRLALPFAHARRAVRATRRRRPRAGSPRPARTSSRATSRDVRSGSYATRPSASGPAPRGPTATRTRSSSRSGDHEALAGRGGRPHRRGALGRAAATTSTPPRLDGSPCGTRIGWRCAPLRGHLLRDAQHHAARRSTAWTPAGPSRSRSTERRSPRRVGGGRDGADRLPDPAAELPGIRAVLPVHQRPRATAAGMARDLDTATRPRRALRHRGNGREVTVRPRPGLAARPGRWPSTLGVPRLPRGRPQVMSADRFGSPPPTRPEQNTPMQVGLTGWAIDYPAPSSFFEQFRCGAADPARFCDPAVDRQHRAALALQGTRSRRRRRRAGHSSTGP